MNEATEAIGEGRPDVRKSIHVLRCEYDADREMYGKTFHHADTKETYQLLFPAFDERTNEKMAVFVLASMPWLKFTRPFERFKARFVEGVYVSPAIDERGE